MRRWKVSRSFLLELEKLDANHLLMEEMRELVEELSEHGLNLTEKISIDTPLRDRRGFADVYSGCLDDGTRVVITRYLLGSDDSGAKQRIMKASPLANYLHY